MRQHILQLDQLNSFNQWVAAKSQQQNPKQSLSNVVSLHKKAPPTLNKTNRPTFKLGFFDPKKAQPTPTPQPQNLDKQNVLKQPPTLVCANCGDISHNSASCGKPSFKSKR